MPSSDRQLHLNVFASDSGHHEASWRHSDCDPASMLDVSYWVELARLAERGKFDAIFIADGLYLFKDVRYHPHMAFEPLTLLAALAVSTERIGLIGTASTTHHAPYNLARQLASIDRISNGRAGWNIVTSGTRQEAENFGGDERVDHDARYERAAEFVHVAKQLWDSWDDEALVLDKDTGTYGRGDLVNAINHVGEHFQVRGPLNVPRPPQGNPVLVQAGSSATGRNYAARYAEAVFTAQPTFEEAVAFYTDVKDRALAHGRDPEQILILPGLVPIVAATEEQALEKRAELDELIIPAFSLWQLSDMFERDFNELDLDGPVPELAPATEGRQSRTQVIADLVAREKIPTLRGLIGRLSLGRAHHVAVGNPEQVADVIEQWFRGRAADGFNLMPATLPSGLNDFIEQVVPVLQRRGLFRTEYSGATLRDHLGLRRPSARFEAQRGAAE
jgi:FMN-dependent oxidoreductase (nitrilotriacetate monooxygenase family)